MNDNKKKVIKTIVLVVCIVVFLVSAVFVGKSVYEKYKEEKMLEELRGQVEPIVPEEIIIEVEKPDYSEALAINDETIGWIRIPGTNVDFPVTQHPDDANHPVSQNFYLTRTFEKKYSVYGSIYMDYRNDPVNLDTNTILYGHNGYNEKVFSDVAKYDSFEFYKEHPVIEFNTLERYYKWKICAVFITNSSASDDNGYAFNYLYPYMEGENFEGYIKEIQKRSLYNTGVDIQPDDKLLTLSTCCRNLDIPGYRANVRIAVVARAVRYGEDETVDVSKATINESPKYPQLYYKKHGLTNPYKNDERWYPED